MPTSFTNFMKYNEKRVQILSFFLGITFSNIYLVSKTIAQVPKNNMSDNNFTAVLTKAYFKLYLLVAFPPSLILKFGAKICKFYLT